MKDSQVNVRSRIVLACCLDKSIDKVVILSTSYARFAEPKIELVF